MMRLRSLIVCGTLAMVGCGLASADPPHASQSGGGGSGGPASGSAAPTGPVRVHLDLARYVARGELRRGNTLVEDLGVPGGAKYTLGGWMTQTGGLVVLEDGTSALLVPGTTAKLNLPRETTGPQTLALRMRALRRGQVTIYINGEVVGRTNVEADGAFHVARVELEESALRAGENTLQLRTPGAGSAPGIRSASLAIDWIRIGPRAEASDESAPPAPSALAPGSSNPPALALAAGWTFGQTLDVPEHARLRGTAKGQGSVEVIATRDGAPRVVLGTFDASASGAAFDVDLRAWPGTSRASICGRVRPASGWSRRRSWCRGAPRRARSARTCATCSSTSSTRSAPTSSGRTTRATRVTNARARPFAQHATALIARAHAGELDEAERRDALSRGSCRGSTTRDGRRRVVPSAVRLLPEMLEERGFHTGAFIANGYVSDAFGFRQRMGHRTETTSARGVATGARVRRGRRDRVARSRPSRSSRSSSTCMRSTRTSRNAAARVSRDVRQLDPTRHRELRATTTSCSRR